MSALSRAERRDEGLEAAVETVATNARELGAAADLERLVEAADDASFVLLGEASHGTGEFYRWRARLTAELIREYDVAFVGVEGDWTDCFAVDRHVRGHPDAPPGTLAVLDGFDRWPTWMWANWEVAEFLEWLREHNAGRSREAQVGFYGLDVYGLYEAMDAVLEYLEDRDPEEAHRARDAYNCFEPYGEDAREYARSTRLVSEDCEEEVLSVLEELQADREYDGRDPEAAFAAEQNALVAKNAESYYRAMTRGGAESWNVRDRHMVETLDRLCDRPAVEGKAVVWAHNTHVGDARATDMADRGKVNVGQLVRERHGADDSLVVGFGTHRGEVVAGEAWGETAERMDVPPATGTSVGDVFHRAHVGDSYLVFEDVADVAPLEPDRGHRAIGVVYDPARELGNYVPTTLPDRYDAFVHLESTGALHTLGDGGTTAGAPETYPWGV